MNDQVTRIACIGDSITAGFSIDEWDDIYPVQLQLLLGSRFDVNPYLGRCGAAVWRNNALPYRSTSQFRHAAKWGSDIFVVCLGTNDTVSKVDDRFKAEFKEDYLSLLEKLKRESPAACIYLCLIPPIFGFRNAGYSAAVPDINKLIQEVAADCGASVIDLNTPFSSREDLFSDGVHPNEAGAMLIAETVYKAVKG